MKMDVNWINFILYFLSVILFAGGILIIYFKNWVPLLVQTIFLYGKVSPKTEGDKLTGGFIVPKIQIPKRFFSHFYLFAFVFYVIIASILVHSYYYRRVPSEILNLLNIICGSNRTANVEPISVIVVMVLLLCQAGRRLYETTLINVYSSSKINLCHYILAIVFYTSLGVSVLAEAPGFTKEGFQSEIFRQMQWHYHQLMGTALYFWVVWHQYKCNLILANLRKDKKGTTMHFDHKIPHGDWFHYVSCPHFLAEILIYLSINIVLNFRNTSMISVLIFTLSNQMVMGLKTHQWYLQSFRDYPRRRKAILPFIL